MVNEVKEQNKKRDNIIAKEQQEEETRRAVEIETEEYFNKLKTPSEIELKMNNP